MTAGLPEEAAPARTRGRWRLTRRTIVVSVFAPTWLDLREATVEDGEATITVFSVFGRSTSACRRRRRASG